MITQAEKSFIKQLLQSPGWRVVEQVAKELIDKQKDSDNVAETQWETARNAVNERGFIQGVNTLIQELYKLAQQDA